MIIKPFMLEKVNQMHSPIQKTHKQSTAKMAKITFSGKCSIMATKKVKRQLVKISLLLETYVIFFQKLKKNKQTSIKTFANSFALLIDADVHSNDDDIVGKDFQHTLTLHYVEPELLTSADNQSSLDTHMLHQLQKTLILY